jgi:peptide/nickel transport system permease protein
LRHRVRDILSSGYFRTRVGTAVVAFFVVVLLNFVLPRLTPGSFIDSIGGQSLLDPQARAQLIARFGLNQSLSQQFVLYLEQLFTGFPPSFGFSFAYYPDSVWQVVSAYLPWTLLLIGASQAIAWCGGVLLGAWLGWTPGSKKNRLMFLSSTFMWGVPSYWIAGILILVFSLRLRWFPPALTSGVAPGSVSLLTFVLDVLSHSFLPVLTLVILALPVYAMVMRNSMVDVLKEDFMIAATARGLKKRSLILGHAARNAILPSITALALGFGTILSGAYLVEIVYSYPGMGYLVYQVITVHDYPVIEGVFFFSAILVIVANLVGDFAYTVLDPRVRYDGQVR